MSCRENPYNELKYERAAKLAPEYRTSYGCITPISSFETGGNPEYESVEDAYGSSKYGNEYVVEKKQEAPWNPERSIELMGKRLQYKERDGVDRSAYNFANYNSSHCKN